MAEIEYQADCSGKFAYENIKLGYLLLFRWCIMKSTLLSL